MLDRKKNNWMRSALVIAIATVTLLAGSASFALYQQNKNIVAAHKWVDHSYQVKSHIQDLLNGLRDAVGGERTYLFTGDENYLAAYKNATRPSTDTQKAPAHPLSISEEIGVLKDLTQDNPTQQNNLENINVLSSQLLAYLAQAIDARKTASAPNDQRLNDPLISKDYMDRLRASLSKMTREEDHLLSLRSKADADSIRRNGIIAFSCIALFYSLLVGVIIAHLRSLNRFQTDLCAMRDSCAPMKQMLASEHELRIRQEQMNEELERFAYICSHDLQEPVRMMGSYADLVNQLYAQNLDEKGRRYLSFIVDNARHMQKLISDILAFSRVGRENLKQEEVNCDALIRTVLSELDAVFTKTNARITVDPLPTVTSSQTLLYVMFQNLIGNALKFQDGTRKLQINVAAKKFDDHWQFSVHDNGIGIDPACNDRVFAIFQRIHRREDFPGTGIGLSTCKKFVELYGGKIWFESQLGLGSHFYFTVPHVMKGSK